MRRLGSWVSVLVTTLSLAACTLPPVDSKDMPNRACPPELSQEALFNADLVRPLDGGGNGLVTGNVVITIAAVTGDPDYEGVMFSDMVVSKTVRVLQRHLPYTGRACMPPDHAVAWLFRVTLADVPEQAYDSLQCSIESADFGVTYAETIRRVELSDLIPGADSVQAQCLWTYVPTNYSGPIPEPPLGHS